MSAAAPSRHTFARASVPATSVGGAEQRRDANLRRIQALKASLSGIVSSRSSSVVAPATRGGSRSLQEGLQRPSLTAAGDAYGPKDAGPIGHTFTLHHQFLQDAHCEVERLMQEKHALTMTCVQQEEQLQHCLTSREGQADGIVTSPRDRHALQPPLSESVDTALRSLLHRLHICYPELLEGLVFSQPTVDGPSLQAENTDASAMSRSASTMPTVTTPAMIDRTVTEALGRLERVMPGLISSSRLGDLFTEAGAELLDRINTLEDEKQSDYFHVLSISEKLSNVNTTLRNKLSQQEGHIRVLIENEEQLRASMAKLAENKVTAIDLLRAERDAGERSRDMFLETVHRLESEVERLKAAAEHNATLSVEGKEPEADRVEALETSKRAREDECLSLQGELAHPCKVPVSHEEERVALEARLQSTTETMGDLQAAKVAVKNDAEDTASPPEEMHTKIEGLQRVIKELQAAMCTRDVDHTSQVANLEAQLKNAVNARLALESELSDAAQALERLRVAHAEAMDTCNRQLTKHHSELESKEREMSEQAGAITAAMAQLERITAANAAQEKSQAVDRQRAKLLQEEMLVLKAGHSEAWAEVERLQAALTLANQQLQELHESTLDAHLKKGETAALLPAEVQVELQQLRARCHELSEYNTILEAQVAEMNRLDTTTFPDVSLNVESEFSSELEASRESALSSLEEELRWAKNAIRRLTSERTATQRKLEARTRSMNEATEKLQATQQQLQSFKTQANGLHSRRNSLSTISRREPTPKTLPKTAPDILPVDYLDFHALAPADSPYPEPIDLQLWLHQVGGPSIKDMDGLSDTVLLRLQSVGYLYHVGHAVLRALGLLSPFTDVHDQDGERHQSWSRLLLQLQHDLSGAVSIQAADSAQCFFILLHASGLWGFLSVEEQWAAVVSGFCQCPGGGSTAAAWPRVQCILEYIQTFEDENAVEETVSFMPFDGLRRQLAMETLQKLVFVSEESGDVWRALATSYALGPVSSLSPKVIESAYVPLLRSFLAFSRHSSFLRPAGSHFDWHSQEIVASAPSDVGSGSRGSELQVLNYLDTRVLAPALVVSHVLRNSTADTLLEDLLTRRSTLYHEASPDLTTYGLSAEVVLSLTEALSASPPFQTEGSSLIDDAELLQLLKENQTYRTHLTNLLSAIEGKG